MDLGSSKGFLAYFTVLNRTSLLETGKERTTVQSLADKHLVTFALIAVLFLMVKFGAEYCAEQYKLYSLCNNADITQQESILCQTEKSNYRTK